MRAGGTPQTVQPDVLEFGVPRSFVDTIERHSLPTCRPRLPGSDQPVIPQYALGLAVSGMWGLTRADAAACVRQFPAVDSCLTIAPSYDPVSGSKGGPWS